MEGVQVILDFPDAGRNAGTQRFGAPRNVLEARRIEDVRAVLRQAEQAAAAGAWVVGFVGYEAAPAFDAAYRVRPYAGPAPLAWFGIFDAPASHAAPTAPALPVLSWTPDTRRADYDAAIAHIRAAIAAGDVYQVNHTIRFHAACDVAPATLFDALRSARHGRYHALIETSRWAIVSASPELFIDIRDGVVTTRPMKGTHRRGRWLEEDRAAAAALRVSAKDRAENLMIVDLLRNDLGRIAEYGSVRVDALYDIETYPTVHQMTSTISARLRDGCTLEDVFAAMFPCGSVTGAPKVAAMSKIAALEHSARGPYCGAVGVLRPDGTATFNVAIRTLVSDRANGRAVYGSGGGITWDSAADAEYDETVAKAALLIEHVPDFALIETLRLEDGRYRRLDLHLDRLARSAQYWGFAASCVTAARAALDALAHAHDGTPLRVRLTVAADGTVDITTAPLDAIPGVRTVRLARTAVSSQDRLLHHKTTARNAYDTRRADFPDAFDVLLHNEHGNITEFTIGNVVCEIAGERVTPPRTDGLLDGCFRRELLAGGTITERGISIAEARTCTRMWLINSVREWVEVYLAADGDEERAESVRISAL